MFVKLAMRLCGLRAIKQSGLVCVAGVWLPVAASTHAGMSGLNILLRFCCAVCFCVMGQSDDVSVTARLVGLTQRLGLC